jgi:hypothetical protein
MEWKNNVERNKKIREMRASGHTMKEIIDATGASRSIISYYFRRTQVIDTDRLHRRLVHVKSCVAKNLAIATVEYQRKWNSLREGVINEAKSEWLVKKNDPDFMGFLGLYWGEGNKSTQDIGITNNDSGVIVAALRFFKQMDPEASFTILIRCNPDQDQKLARAFWESALGTEVIVKPKDWIGKITRSRSSYGICSVRYCSWITRQKILTWIDCWRSELGTSNFMET